MEKAAFTPLVFSTTGGMGKEAVLFYKKAAEKISNTTNQSYSDVISYIRKRLRFKLLKTCLISIRGYRGIMKKRESEDMSNLDYNLIRESSSYIDIFVKNQWKTGTLFEFLNFQS